MKKNNQKGFVLAETLVVTVFLMVIFAMVYSNFYPLMGEYEKREVYDDVDGKYSAYWLKQMVESAVYDISGSDLRKYNFDTYGYVRFECKDLTDVDSRTVCKNIVSSLQINGCDGDGNFCDIFITNYQLGHIEEPLTIADFKQTVRTNLRRYKENCKSSESACLNSFVNNCKSNYNRKFANATVKQSFCEELANKIAFTGGFQDYVLTLPDYITPSQNYAYYRVIAIVHNTRDNNNYYSYETMEVAR